MHGCVYVWVCICVCVYVICMLCVCVCVGEGGEAGEEGFFENGRVFTSCFFWGAVIGISFVEKGGGG